MKKIFYTMALILVFCGTAGAATYYISTPEQLDGVRTGHLNDICILSNDINLTTYLGGVGSDDGKGWLPIGTLATPFTGTFDGNGHVISGLRINRDTTDMSACSVT